MDPIESPWKRVITLTVAIMLGLAVPIGMGIAGATSHDIETTEAEDTADETEAPEAEEDTSEAETEETTEENTAASEEEDDAAATEGEEDDLETQSGDGNEESDVETTSGHDEDFNWTRDWTQAAHGLCNAWDANENGRGHGNASNAPPFLWLASEAEAGNESVEDYCAGVEAPHGSHHENGGDNGNAGDHASEVATSAQVNGADGAPYGPPDDLDTAAAPEDEESDAEAATNDEEESTEDEPGAGGRSIADDARSAERGAATAE